MPPRLRTLTPARSPDGAPRRGRRARPPRRCASFRVGPSFFFNDAATTEFYTLSLHDALPISPVTLRESTPPLRAAHKADPMHSWSPARSEEHTSELQSQSNRVCRLLLEK